MIEPTSPDPVGAAYQVRIVIPATTRRLADGLRKANQQLKKMPAWRDQQITQFLKYLGTFADDLDDGYHSRRNHRLGHAVRNLIELYVWTLYSGASEENARRFYEDVVRDVRDVLETLQKLYKKVNSQP